MGEACGTRDGVLYTLLWEILNERDNLEDLCMISGFRREVDENHALLGYYVASSGNSLPTLRDNLSALSSRVGGLFTFEDGTDYLSRNVGIELPLLAA
jgi:hypothetical protein